MTDHNTAVPLTTKGLSRPDRKQLAYDLGLMGLSRRECIEQLVHKELLIRQLKARVSELEATEAASCPASTPEPHLLGEFPLSCYRCHLEADS